MLSLSTILIGNSHMSHFEELLDYVRAQARKGEIFIEFDVRPPFPDTPDDWEQQLEVAFTSASNIR